MKPLRLVSYLVLAVALIGAPAFGQATGEGRSESTEKTDAVTPPPRGGAQKPAGQGTKIPTEEEKLRAYCKTEAGKTDPRCAN